MTAATMTGFVDRRRPECESRRKNDCFPSAGAVTLCIGFASLIAFAAGLAIGAWVF